MRIAITGATGNVGTSVIRALEPDSSIEAIVGLARRLPEIRMPKTSWVQADVVHSDLAAHFEGADAVIHLAWLIQPSRDQATLHATNVEGSARVFRAAGRAGVKTLVYASSVGAYSPGPKDRQVDESWPTEGIETSTYSRQKAQIEREYEGMRVVRLRPGLIFKREREPGPSSASRPTTAPTPRSPSCSAASAKALASKRRRCPRRPAARSGSVSS